MGHKKLVVMMKRSKRWWRSCQRLGTAGLGDLWKSLLAAHPAILYWERLVFQPCSTPGASRAVNSCTGQHWPISVSDQITLGRILGFLLCCQVVLADRGCFLSSSWRTWSNSLAIRACSLEKVEQSLEGGDLRDQPQNRCWSYQKDQGVFSLLFIFSLWALSEFLWHSEFLMSSQGRVVTTRNAWRALNKSWKAG